ncbi:hypothetical protein C8J56DRAFT_967927 [Mycena floridula]|nr:hypothetical protein C8J56DRAFT_994253 [Mycena floridula]KAJ7578439.1 hypothetical protein C8J56DRAFT_967927 [Mycena floridula]
MAGRRLYLGRLPADTRPEDVSTFFEGYGRIIDCRVMTGFGFVEFEHAKDAEDAVTNFNGKPFLGANSILVEFAKESRPRREPHGGGDDRGHGGPRSRRPPGIRILVQGVSRDTSWQDLKDFGRECGSVTFADIDRDVAGQGILEYTSREDADRAIKELDGRDLRGKTVRVAFDESRGGPDNFRRDDRPPRDDRYREDRYRDDRYRDERPYRRERSRSPPRRSEYDDRRPPRSPPRREAEDRRPAGYDYYSRRDDYYDRRSPDIYYDRRRDESERPRRDDRKRDEREYEERPRHTNGDGGWAR